MLVFVDPTFAFSVASTKAPLGIAFWSVTIAVVTPLSRAALQSGMPSPVTGSAMPPETLLTVQSGLGFPATTVRQTGSLNVAVMRVFEIVKLENDGFVVSAKT